MATVEIEESTLRELAALLGAVRDSATPGLAERISTMIVSLGAVAAEVEPTSASALVEAAMDNAEALTATIQQLGEWHRTGAWGSLTETMALVSALTDSATPQLAERMAGLAVGLGQIAAEAGPGVAQTVSAVEAHGNILADMVHQVANWQQDGTWKVLMDTVSLIKGLNDSVTSPMVERTLSTATDALLMLSATLDSGLLTLGIRTAEVFQAAVKDAATDTTRVSATGLLRSLKDPEIQRGMRIMLALLRRMPNLIES